MGRTILISSCRLSRQVVHKILCSDHRVVTVACKQVLLDKPENLVLLTIGTLDGDVYVFDIKRCKELMLEGEVWRILQNDQITKVMHDCRYTSTGLKSQFSVILNNVFDTQAAYCVLMMLRSLPPRFIHLYHLYEKYGDPGQKYNTEMQTSVGGGGIFWAQRPISDAMLQSAATDVQLLFPIYDNLKRELCPTHEDVLLDLCYAYIHGRFKVKACTNPSDTGKHRPRQPILRLTDAQTHLLEHTIPQSAGTLKYDK